MCNSCVVNYYFNHEGKYFQVVVVVKHNEVVLFNAGNATEQEIKSFFNEADVMKRLSSQSCNYVVQLVGLQVEQAPVMIAMELIPCGNLLDILKSSRISVR